MALCYDNDVLVISEHPKLTIEGLKRTFRLKGDNSESPTIYRGANLNIVENESGSKCWTMFLEDYVKMTVQNVEDHLKGINQSLPTKCKVPVSPGYSPAVYEIPDLDEDGIKTYQELIGVLRWEIEIGRVDIILEVALISTHLEIQRKGHLEKVYPIFRYLKQRSRRRLFFDTEHPDISGESFTRLNWEY